MSAQTIPLTLRAQACVPDIPIHLKRPQFPGGLTREAVDDELMAKTHSEAALNSSFLFIHSETVLHRASCGLEVACLSHEDV